MVKAHGCCRLFVLHFSEFDYFCVISKGSKNEATGFSTKNSNLPVFGVRATALIVKDNRLFVIEDEDGCCANRRCY